MPRTEQRGFTLIELLIVVVIIGILAGIAIPKFANTKEKAYIAAMKADLRNLVTAQEAYLAEQYTYAPDKATLNYRETRGVTVTLSNVVVNGWSAEAVHTGTNVRCYIFYGSGGTPIGVATAEGEVACK